MDNRDLRVNAVDHHVEMQDLGLDEWAISVWCEADCDADEVAKRSPIRNRKIMVSTVGAIRALGYDVVPSDEPPHADLKFPDEPSDDIFYELKAVFDPPRDNPRLEGGS